RASSAGRPRAAKAVRTASRRTPVPSLGCIAPGNPCKRARSTAASRGSVRSTTTTTARAVRRRSRSGARTASSRRSSGRSAPRNQHLTQGTTSVPVPGDHFVYLRLDDVAPGSGPGVAEPILAGVDGSLTSLADHPGGGSGVLRRELEVAQRHADLATECFRLDETQRAGPALLNL